MKRLKKFADTETIIGALILAFGINAVCLAWVGLFLAGIYEPQITQWAKAVLNSIG